MPPPALPSSDDLILTFATRDGRPVLVRKIVTAAVSAAKDAPAGAGPAGGTDRNAHTADFATVRWNGRTFALSPTQRAIINVLWQAHADGVPFVAEATLLTEVESAGKRVDELFRRLDGWRHIIDRGSKHGGPP